jgi:hypothetical protein
MSNIPLLFQLPHAWLVAFLSEWLDMPTIGMLDTSISSKAYRSQFLNGLQHMRPTSVDNFSNGRGQGLLGSKSGDWTGYWWRWLSFRRVRIESIVLYGKEVRSDLVIPSMRKVITYCFEDDDLRHLVRNCPSLQSLALKSFDNLVTGTGLRTLTDLHQSLEEFSFVRYSSDQLPQTYYTDTAAALMDVLRQCSRLHKVSLTGDILHFVNLEELLPYGHLFHELEFGTEGRTAADAHAVSNLLAKCSNLRKLRYDGSDVEQDSLVIEAVCQSCPLLEELELLRFSFNQQEQIAGAVPVAGAGTFILLNRSCKHLRRLDLAHCQLSVSILRSIAGMESLKELTLYDCEGLTDAGMAALATMKLESLTLELHAQLTGAWIQSFVGSNISQTLETLDLIAYGIATAIDDVQVATSLACCHNLKKLDAYFGVNASDGCVFGHNGLDSLQAMAAGCPSLADIKLYLTVAGLHYLGTHFTNLKKCHVYKTCEEAASAPDGFPSIEELQALYPAVVWGYAG